MTTRLEEIKCTKYVGIVIHDKANLYSNGITQNAYFIYQCLEHIGMKCILLCPDPNPSKFEYRDLPLKQISCNPLEFDPSEFHTIITVTRGVTKEEYNMFKKANVFVVAFTCGNTLMHHMEDFVRGPIHKHTTTYIGKNSLCDEVWVIPSYKHSLEYISLTRGKPAFIVPHLWSPQFISETVVKFNKKTKEDLIYDYTKHVNPKIDILIVEPNVALFKNAWIPIMACEKLHLLNSDLIDNVYVFNMPEHENSYKMIDNLAVGSKLRKFKRLAMPDIMTHFNDKKSFPVILCHHILNSLNYVYYEALYYGWPLIHNSLDLEDCGYFYPENDISACANAILDAYKHHNKNVELYTEKAHNYLKRVDPLDAEVGKIWKGLINCGLSKSLP